MLGMMGSGKGQTAQGKVNIEWDGMAGEWDDLAGCYANGFFKMLCKTTGLDPSDLQGAIIVDFGCGTGLLTAKLRRIAARVVGIDASPKMIEMLQDKILTREWDNVQALSAALGNISEVDESVRKVVDELEGKVDLVVASSVLTFIPPEDVEATMSAIGRLLKPGGIFCHSDWPKSEAKHPGAMTEEKATRFFGMAGLQVESTQIIKMSMGVGDSDPEVFVGVARKP
jgi:SAM-dependent methyltransferase